MRLVISAVLIALALATPPAWAGETPPSLRWSAARHGVSSMPLTPWMAQNGTALPFAAYVAATRQALDDSRREIEPDAAIRARAVDRVAPREWPLAKGCDGKAKAGVLLVHGLSDSPFLMRDVGDVLASADSACRRVRAILLPGHGSIPGDLIRPTAANWQAALRYGVESFAGDVGRVDIVGFSTGAALALDLVLNQPPTTPAVGALVLLSPAIGLANRMPLHRIPYGFETFAAIMRIFSGFAPEGDWLRLAEDLDDSKYESFPVMAPKPLMQVMEQVDLATRPLTVPVLMAFSAEDVTVDAQASLDIFTAKVGNPASRALVYVSPAALAAGADRYGPLAAKDPRILCLHGPGPAGEGCAPTPATPPARCPFGDEGGECVTAISHIALPVSPANPHYGRGGDTHSCLGYSDRRDAAAYCGCLTPAQRSASALCQGVTASTAPLRFGEPVKGDLADPAVLTARLGYNPDFERMMAMIVSFLDRTADPAPPR